MFLCPLYHAYFSTSTVMASHSGDHLFMLEPTHLTVWCTMHMVPPHGVYRHLCMDKQHAQSLGPAAAAGPMGHWYFCDKKVGDRASCHTRKGIGLSAPRGGLEYDRHRYRHHHSTHTRRHVVPHPDCE